jgi:hypothetical protein
VRRKVPASRPASPGALAGAAADDLVVGAPGAYAGYALPGAATALRKVGMAELSELAHTCVRWAKKLNLASDTNALQCGLAQLLFGLHVCVATLRPTLIPLSHAGARRGVTFACDANLRTLRFWDCL